MKDVIEYLMSLKTSCAFNDHRNRAFIDSIIYKLENGLSINYLPNKDDIRNRIVKIAKDFDKKSYNPEITIETKKGTEKPKETKKQPKKPSKKEDKK